MSLFNIIPISKLNQS